MNDISAKGLAEKMLKIDEDDMLVLVVRAATSISTDMDGKIQNLEGKIDVKLLMIKLTRYSLEVNLILLW